MEKKKKSWINFTSDNNIHYMSWVLIFFHFLIMFLFWGADVYYNMWRDGILPKRAWPLFIAKGAGRGLTLCLSFLGLLTTKILAPYSLKFDVLSRILSWDKHMKLHEVLGVSILSLALIHALVHVIDAWALDLYPWNFGFCWSLEKDADIVTDRSTVCQFITGLFLFLFMFVTSIWALKFASFRNIFDLIRLSSKKKKEEPQNKKKEQPRNKPKRTSFYWFALFHKNIFPLVICILVFFHCLTKGKPWPAIVIFVCLFPLALINIGKRTFSKKRTFKFKIFEKKNECFISLVSKEGSSFVFNSGQYAELCIDDVIFNDFHPFTLASSGNEVSFLIKVENGWTKVLSDLLRSYESNGKDSIEGLAFGPFAAPSQDYNRYDGSFFIGYGSGITPCLSVIQEKKAFTSVATDSGTRKNSSRIFERKKMLYFSFFFLLFEVTTSLIFSILFFYITNYIAVAYLQVAYDSILIALYLFRVLLNTQYILTGNGRVLVSPLLFFDSLAILMAIVNIYLSIHYIGQDFLNIHYYIISTCHIFFSTISQWTIFFYITPSMKPQRRCWFLMKNSNIKDILKSNPSWDFSEIEEEEISDSQVFKIFFSHTEWDKSAPEIKGRVNYTNLSRDVSEKVILDSINQMASELGPHSKIGVFYCGGPTGQKLINKAVLNASSQNPQVSISFRPESF